MLLMTPLPAVLCAFPTPPLFIALMRPCCRHDTQAQLDRIQRAKEAAEGRVASLEDALRQQEQLMGSLRCESGLACPETSVL